MLLCYQHQAIQAGSATGLRVRQRAGEIQQGLQAVPVGGARRVVGKEVRQVGADDDQRARVAPQLFQHLRHFCGACIAHCQRHQRETLQHGLQKRQLHFQRMLLRMGGRAHHHLWQAGQQRDGQRVHGHLTQWRGERGGTRQGQPPHRETVRRPQQHHTVDRVAPGLEQGVGLSRGSAAVDIAGVRHDQHFRWPQRWVFAGSDLHRIQQSGDGARQLIAGGRVEAAGNGGRSNG